MARVLVTGASGFIGSQTLKPLLDEGHEVHAVHHPDIPPSLDLPNCNWHSCDLFERMEQRHLFSKVRPTHLLHLAWYTKHGEYWNSPENLRWVEASLELALNLREAGGERLVVAGSCAEYDWSFGRCTEMSTPTRPATLYGVCKHELHQIIQGYCRQTGLSYAWGRLFFLYGPGENPARFLPSLVLSLLQGKPFLCRHGGNVRDFLFSGDAGEAFVRLLESEVQGPVNIASGQPVSLRELTMKVVQELGRPELIEFGDPNVPSDEPVTLVADVERLAQEVGWVAPIDGNEGLKETIEWWRNTLAKEEDG